MGNDPAIYSVKPQIIERVRGGWMAITPRGWPLSIGVMADSEAEARAAFDAELLRWAKIGVDENGKERC